MLYIALIVLVVIMRLIPHAANVAPVAALALFAGATVLRTNSKAERLLAVVAPLVALIVSDLLIGTYTWQVMLAVYLCYALSFGLGLLVHEHYGAKNIAAATLTGSVVFYLVTNAAVWAFTPMYVKNFAGLLESYTLALPFFRNSLLGDLLFVGVLFGAYELAKGKFSLFSVKLSNKKILTDVGNQVEI